MLFSRKTNRKNVPESKYSRVLRLSWEKYKLSIRTLEYLPESIREMLDINF